MPSPPSPDQPEALNLAHYGVTDGVNGPGRRYTLWVQGCPQRCPGCFNPGLQAEVPRIRTPPKDLALTLASFAPLDGITLSGGEPFAQAAAVSRFLDLAAERWGAQPLPVIAFSGYTLAELEGGPPEWTQLLGRIDLLVDGPYLEDLAPSEPLTGSGNQHCIALTAVGTALMEEMAAVATPALEVQIAADGEVLVSGFPSPELLRQLRGSD